MEKNSNEYEAINRAYKVNQLIEVIDAAAAVLGQSYEMTAECLKAADLTVWEGLDKAAKLLHPSSAFTRAMVIAHYVIAE